MNEQKHSIAVEALKRKINDITTNCKSCVNDTENAYKGWVLSADEADKQLDSMVDSLSDYYKKKLRPYITEEENRLKKGVPLKMIMFEKFTYYIDSLNEMEIPIEPVLSKNPNYCNSVLKKLAAEYVALKTHIKNQRSVKENEKTDAVSSTMAKNKKDVERYWETHQKAISLLAKEDMEEVFEEIKKSIQ